jgi:hypothetical protein
MEISIGTVDRKIWTPDSILKSLYTCMLTNDELIIDLGPDGPCATELGLYYILDEFCNRIGINKEVLIYMSRSKPVLFSSVKTYKKTFERMRFLFYILAKFNLVPQSFYNKYTKKCG